MVKKAFNLLLLSSLLWSCATYQPPPPSFHIGNLPPSLVAELSLEERIILEDAWNNLQKGRANKAEKIIHKLGEQSPAYSIGLGYTYYLLNRLQAAEESFKAALANYPDMVIAHTGLAQIYQKTGREDKAFAECREILKKDPENPWAKQQYETLKNKKTEEAITEAKDALAKGEAEKGKGAFLKALYYSPKSSEVHLNLAEIYKKENNLPSALIHLKAASSNEPGNREILKNYAETLYQAGNYSRSLEIYEKLQAVDPENKEIKKQINSLKDRLGIFELPSQYDSIAYSEAVTKEQIAALLGVKFKGIVDEVSTSPPIIIDIATSWASKFILQMTSLGILDIYPDHSFQPKKIVTRAEMAEILVRFIDYLQKKGFKFIQQIQPEKIQAADVSAENYYHKPIIKILSYDIMGLTSEKEFNPDFPVPGQESIKLLDIILALIK